MSESPPIDRAKAGKPMPKPGIMDIHAYVPGKASAQGIANPVKLSANENPLGSSPKAHEAYASADRSLHVYPDPRTSIVRAAISEAYGVEPERLIFGCGSDEVFALLNQTFLANPGNPTGTWIPFTEVERLHAALPPSVVLVLDGAYSEFCLDPTFNDGMDFARDKANVVVTHTFSKLHGLAALRIGWGYAPAEVASAVDRIRLPFNTSIAAQRAAVAALGDKDFQQQTIDLNETWRPRLAQQLGGMGLDVIGPSAANFVLIGFPKTPGRTATEAEAHLSAKGLLVRQLLNYGMPDHLRMTIGLEEQNRALIDALAEFMGG